ncbi:MAG: multiheme c-type cytochrome [Lutibacter sp.]
MPKLIFRLFLTFVVFVGIFILIQQLLTPESFGEYGHYRANALDDNKMSTSFYKGESKCNECHQDIFDQKALDVHDAVRCESCHSPKIDASTDCKVSPPIVKGTIKFCAECHATNPARLKKGVPQLDFKEHYEKQNCIECHNPHAPWELKEEK